MYIVLNNECGGIWSGELEDDLWVLGRAETRTIDGLVRVIVRGREL